MITPFIPWASNTACMESRSSRSAWMFSFSSGSSGWVLSSSIAMVLGSLPVQLERPEGLRVFHLVLLPHIGGPLPDPLVHVIHAHVLHLALVAVQGLDLQVDRFTDVHVGVRPVERGQPQASHLVRLQAFLEQLRELRAGGRVAGHHSQDG